MTTVDGRQPVPDVIRVAQSGGGLSHYHYLDPSDNTTVKPKIAYAMLVDQDWLIGSGVYNANEGDPFIRRAEDPLVRENLTSFVNEAVAYARTHGRAAALQEFNDPNGSFVRGDLYVFALDYNQTNLAHPFRPELVGTDRSGARDSLGVNYTRVQGLVAQRGGGFVFYRYPNPEHTMTPESKMSYVAPVDDAWYVGGESTRSLRARTRQRPYRARGPERTYSRCTSRPRPPTPREHRGSSDPAGHQLAVRPAPTEVPRSVPGKPAQGSSPHSTQWSTSLMTDHRGDWLSVFFPSTQ